MITRTALNRLVSAVVPLALVGAGVGLVGCSPSSASATGTRPLKSGAPTFATPKAPTTSPVLRGYEFPGGMIAANTSGVKTYSRVDGLLALPGTAGPHPVAVIVHGSYPSCLDLPNDRLLTSQVQTTPWPEGCGTNRSSSGGLSRGPDFLRTPASLGYLAQALAERGFAVVVPDVSSKNRADWGTEPEPRQLQANLVKTHLSMLDQLNRGNALGLPWGGQVKGRLDLESISLIGHSSGGAFALDSSLTSNVPNLKAAVALEPALHTLPSRSASKIPTLVIGGECDEQMAIADTRRLVESVPKVAPSVPLVFAVVPSTVHISLLAGGGDHRVGPVIPSDAASCAPSALLPKPTQRSQAAQLTADFVSQAVVGKRHFQLHSVPGAKPKIDLTTGGAKVTLTPVKAAPVEVAPKSVPYSRSTVVVLPPKPASLVLDRGEGGYGD